MAELKEFLSTPSARRATNPAATYESIAYHFYPRPPRGGRRPADSCCRSKRFISIHALREEGDLIAAYIIMNEIRFLSTPSARRATYAFLSCL